MIGSLKLSPFISISITVFSIIKTVEVYAMPFPDFSYTEPCLSDTLFFTDLSTIEPSEILTSWVWTFNNGDTSYNQHPYTLYNSPGKYKIKLIAISQNNCSRSKLKEIQIFDHVRPTEIKYASVEEDTFIRIAWSPVYVGRPMEYIIERSLDNKNYTIIGNVGPHVYEFDDDRVRVDQRSYYYRLVVLDSCS